MSRSRRLLTCLSAGAAAAVLAWAAAGVQKDARAQEPPPVVEPTAVTVTTSPILWRRSTALGLPWSGALVNGVRLPSSGTDWFTWDPVFNRVPNRPSRRWGTDYLLRKLLRVCRTYRAENFPAPRCAVGDLSRRYGGDFGPRFGGLGHGSHQNGLDVDVYYPRLDLRERAPHRVDQIDLELSQALVDAFVAEGATYVFVGPNTGLTGPPRIVQPLVHHDDHMHVRFPNRRRL